MENHKTSTFSNGLLWFGAAISIAEIFTGTLLAPLGFKTGILAIIIGHVIGCILLYYAGTIGAESGKSSMESVGYSFGSQGRIFFALLNVLQLVGWTAVMIIQGARAMGIILNSNIGIHGDLIWCIVIGITVLIWIVMGTKNIEKVNIFAIGGLLVLTFILSFVVFKGSSPIVLSEKMSFGLAVELSVAMPLSWLPLISDYTKDAKNPILATRISVISYFIGSVFMYIIGLGSAIFTGESDIATIMFKSGLGLIGVFIILLSTVTTTYLDVYSAGVSLKTINKKLPERVMTVIVCVIGTLMAMFFPIEQYQNFLYLIGSVFTPMIAILTADYFILKKDHSNKSFNVANCLIWVAGFLIYRMFLNINTIIGSTVPVMLITIIICVIVNKLTLFGSKKVKEEF